MTQNIFKDKRSKPGKLIRLLTFYAGAAIIVLVIVAAIIWWQRPIVIVRIGDLSLDLEVENLNLWRQVKSPDLALSLPRIHGSLNIKIENIGRSPAADILLNFLPQSCKLGKLQIYKTEADCVLNIKQPKNSLFNPESGLGGIAAQDSWYFISIRELRPGSEIKLKYIVYREGEEEPLVKFGKISSSNAKVKIFYYR